MDRKIKKLESKEKEVSKGLKSLEKADVERDKFVDAGKKAMKKK